LIKPVKLFLIRHAPVKSLSGFFPQNDSNAIIEHSKFKKLAKFIPPDCIWYVSPLKRTLQTAKALSKYVSYSEMIKDKDLIEQNYGDWSGKKISEIWKTLSEIKNKHNFSFISPEILPPNGESFVQQCKRIQRWVEKLNISDKKNIVIISHAGTIRAFLSHALKIDPEYSIGVEIQNQSLSIFEMLAENDSKYRGGRFRLITLNKIIY
tara:strand:+ start:2217 stop:2840 length:624 start_codon:yes stop_codon:yes gene_type:complete